MVAICFAGCHIVFFYTSPGVANARNVVILPSLALYISTKYQISAVDLNIHWGVSCSFSFLSACVFSCGAALVAGMPLCAVPVHSGRWGAGGGDRVPETERRRPAPNRRHEPLLERDQTQVPQHPVRGHSHRCLLGTIHFVKTCNSPSRLMDVFRAMMLNVSERWEWPRWKGLRWYKAPSLKCCGDPLLYGNKTADCISKPTVWLSQKK